MCGSQITHFWFSLYKCVSYDGQCIVMNVLQLFRLSKACIKKLFLCLAVLVVGIADLKATVSKREWARVCGVQSDFLSPFPHSGDVKTLEVGQGALIFLSAVLNVCCSLLMSSLVAEPNQTGPGPTTPLPNPPCPLPSLTSPFSHPNYSSPSSKLSSSKRFLSLYASLCCSVLF